MPDRGQQPTEAASAPEASHPLDQNAQLTEPAAPWSGAASAPPPAPPSGPPRAASSDAQPGAPSAAPTEAQSGAPFAAPTEAQSGAPLAASTQAQSGAPFATSTQAQPGAPLAASTEPQFEAPRATSSEARLATAGESHDGPDAEPFGLSVVGSGDEREAPRHPRARRVVLISILAVGLVGLSVLGWAGWQINSQKDARISTPAQVAGLRLDTSESGRETADYLQNALSAEVDLDKAVGAVYTDGSRHDVLFFGGTATIWSPGSDLKSAFGLISDDQGAVTGIHDVPAGRYGGTMRCGTTKTADGVMPVCGWADHGSIAVAMFPSRTEAESAKLLLDIRYAALKRN